MTVIYKDDILSTDVSDVSFDYGEGDIFLTVRIHEHGAVAKYGADYDKYAIFVNIFNPADLHFLVVAG